MQNLARLPQHVAIIMDGNGRWAQRRGRPRVFGHIRGASRIKNVVREANRLGIKAITLYAFSTENWARPDSELSVLWKLLTKYLRREVSELQRQGVRLHMIGELERLDPAVYAEVQRSVDLLKENQGLQLTFAVSYGSRRELVRAAQLFAQDCVDGKQSPRDMDERLMNHYLWTSNLGSLSEVDLVVRTSGEQRVSNFLLWQAAYAEFVFIDLCWPDFGPENLRLAVEEYQKRERRYGGLVTQNKAENESTRPIRNVNGAQ